MADRVDNIMLNSEKFLEKALSKELAKYSEAEKSVTIDGIRSRGQFKHTVDEQLTKTNKDTSVQLYQHSS